MGRTKENIERWWYAKAPAHGAEYTIGGLARLRAVAPNISKDDARASRGSVEQRERGRVARRQDGRRCAAGRGARAVRAVAKWRVDCVRISKIRCDLARAECKGERGGNGGDHVWVRGKKRVKSVEPRVDNVKELARAVEARRVKGRLRTQAGRKPLPTRRLATGDRACFALRAAGRRGGRREVGGRGTGGCQVPHALSAVGAKTARK